MKNPTFFGQELKNNGICYALDMAKGVTVCCWLADLSARNQWTAKIVGTVPTNDIVLADGRTAQEACRRLERKTLTTIKALVATFARAFQQLGIGLPRKLTQVKKKARRT